MIYLLYGQPASGKTSLGKKLASYLRTPFVIDGDEFRKMFSNADYQKEGRELNIQKANAVATFLNKTQKKDVILLLVNPYERFREELKVFNKGEVLEILLISTRTLRKNYHCSDFERGNPKFELNTDKELKRTWRDLLEIIDKRDFY